MGLVGSVDEATDGCELVDEAGDGGCCSTCVDDGRLVILSFEKALVNFLPDAWCWFFSAVIDICVSSVNKKAKAVVL